MNGFTFNGIDQTLVNSIMKCDYGVQKDLYANIVLEGGTTLLEGFPERYANKIIRLAPPTMKTKVFAPLERKYSAWIGGSILGSLSQFPQMVIANSKYKEIGSGVSRMFQN